MVFDAAHNWAKGSEKALIGDSPNRELFPTEL